MAFCTRLRYKESEISRPRQDFDLSATLILSQASIRGQPVSDVNRVLIC